MPKVLVACEESQAITIAMREIGLEAYSCDLLPCSGGHPEWHLRQDVIPLLSQPWDLVIAHPPCTHLACSGARHFKAKQQDGRQQAAIDFFMQFTRCNSPRVAIENPVCIMSSHYRKPDQVIQPWMFGYEVRKAICLWLKGLPLLKPTEIVDRGVNAFLNVGPYKDRAKMRSVTLRDIAVAMADQWGRPLLVTDCSN